MKEFIKKLQALSNKQKLAIIVVVVVIATLIMGYFWIKDANNSLSKIGQSGSSINLPNLDLPAVPTPSPEVSPTPEDPTANWKMYENTQYGFLIKYPPSVKIQTNPASQTSAALEIGFLVGNETLATSNIFMRVYIGQVIKTMPIGEIDNVVNYINKNGDVLVQISHSASANETILNAINSTLEFTR